MATASSLLEKVSLDWNMNSKKNHIDSTFKVFATSNHLSALLQVYPGSDHHHPSSRYCSISLLIPLLMLSLPLNR